VRNVKVSGNRAANCTVYPVDSRDIASGRIQQKTPLPAIPLLLHDVVTGAYRIENTVPSGTPIGYVAWLDVFHCCVTVCCAIT
jgi:hypothetical protein